MGRSYGPKKVRDWVCMRTHMDRVNGNVCACETSHEEGNPRCLFVHEASTWMAIEYVTAATSIRLAKRVYLAPVPLLCMRGLARRFDVLRHPWMKVARAFDGAIGEESCSRIVSSEKTEVTFCRTFRKRQRRRNVGGGGGGSGGSP